MTGKTLNTDTAVAADAERDTEMTEKITREEIELILQAADTHIKAGWPRSTIDPVTVSALCTLALQAEAMQPREENTVYITFQNDDLFDSIIHHNEDDAWCEVEADTGEPREALQLDGFEVKAFTLTSLPEPRR